MWSKPANLSNHGFVNKHKHVTEQLHTMYTGDEQWINMMHIFPFSSGNLTSSGHL